MVEDPKFWRHCRKIGLSITALATVYVITGSLAMLLAVPPSPAAPFWPPAGVALLAVLTCGRAVAPGALLGSLLLHLGLAYIRDEGFTASGVLLSLGVGTGAALQALVGGALVRRWVGWPSPLLREGEVFAFMLAGPTSCLVNALWSGVLLCLAGVHGWSDLPYNAAVWWVGDSIGTLVVPVMLLPFLGEVGEHWHARRQTVSLPMALAASLTVGFFGLVRGQDQRSLQLHLEADAQRLARRFQEMVTSDLDVLHLLAGQAGSDGRWTGPDFQAAAEVALARKTDLTLVGFLAIVPHAERAEFETQLRRRFPASRGLLEFDEDQRLRPAKVRDRYTVVEWGVPESRYRGVFGLDVSSEPIRRAALDRAAQTHLPAVAVGVRLPTRTEKARPTVVFFLPVFARRAPATAGSGPSEHRLTGYVATALDVDQLVERLSQELNQPGLRLLVELPGLVSAETGDAASSKELSTIAAVMLADVPGRLTLVAGPEFLQANRSWPAWASLAAGLVGTGLLGMLLLGLTGRAALTAQQVAERTAELAEREEMFRLLAEATQDAIGIASTDRRVLYISPAFFRMTGWTLEDIRRTDYRTRCHAEDLSAVERAREANLAGQSTRVEWRCLRADRAYFWMETSATPILGPDGRVERIVTSSRDVSARKAAEQALRDGQQRLRLALMAGKMGTWEWDVATGKLVWDEQEAALFGLRVAQLTQTDRDFFERIHVDDAAGLREALDQCRLDRTDFETEFRIHRTDGQIRWIAARGRYDYDLAGRATRMTGVNYDVTESRLAEEALRQAHAFTRRLIDSSLDMIIAVDDQRRITEFNRAAEKTFGYRRDEVLGRAVDVLYANPSDGDRIHAQSLRADGVVVEILNRRRSGEVFPSLLSASVLRDASGQLLGMMGVSRDVTQIKRSEERLRQTMTELARSNAELAAFASVAGHDLQEPLRTIAGSVKLLARRYSGKLGPDAERFIQFAVQGAERMQRMIADLLEYSRLGSRGLRREAVDFQVVAAAVVTDLHAAIAESGARVELAPLPIVRADAAQISRLLLNFLGNALKFRAPERPLVVRVDAQRLNGAWRICVSDNGIGIAAQHAGRLFTLFQRLHTTQQYPGTGMGLAVCKKIVEQHGGRIGLLSQPNQGSTFWMELPDSPEPDSNSNTDSGDLPIDSSVLDTVRPTVLTPITTPTSAPNTA